MIFVTHKNPHLDEVVAAWLMRTYDPVMKDCQFLFISNTPTGGNVPTGDRYVPVGVGRGKFDEHGMLAGHSACQLIYQDLLHRGLIPNDEVLKKALDILVDHTHRADTGKWTHIDPESSNFSIHAILRGLSLVNYPEGSPVMMGQGLIIIEALLASLKQYASFLKDWEHRIEFESIWGKAVGVQTQYRAADVFAYHQGFILRVQTNPKKHFGDFRATVESTVDLTPIFDKVNAAEPNTWFLHQTKRILVANSDTATGAPGTNLSLPQLIDLVKKR